MKNTIFSILLFTLFYISTANSANRNDIDYLTSYAVLLGRGIACGIDVSNQSSRVANWIDRRFPPGSADQITYLPIFMSGVQYAATQQSSGNSPDACSQVHKSLSSTPWP